MKRGYSSGALVPIHLIDLDFRVAALCYDNVGSCQSVSMDSPESGFLSVQSRLVPGQYCSCSKQPMWLASSAAEGPLPF